MEKQDQKQEVSIELNELVMARLNNLAEQQQHIQTIAEVTMITAFEQAGIKVPPGVSMELKGNKLLYVDVIKDTK